MNYRDFLQKVIYVMINPLIKAMIKIGITPNIVTLVGFIGNILATCFFIDAAWILGMGGIMFSCSRHWFVSAGSAAAGPCRNLKWTQKPGICRAFCSKSQL